MASQIFKVRWGIGGETFSLPIRLRLKFPQSISLCALLARFIPTRFVSRQKPATPRKSAEAPMEVCFRKRTYRFSN